MRDGYSSVQGLGQRLSDEKLQWPPTQIVPIKIKPVFDNQVNKVFASCIQQIKQTITLKNTCMVCEAFLLHRNWVYVKGLLNPFSSEPLWNLCISGSYNYTSVRLSTGFWTFIAFEAGILPIRYRKAEVYSMLINKWDRKAWAELQGSYSCIIQSNNPTTL